jgi:hypothetical protein
VLSTFSKPDSQDPLEGKEEDQMRGRAGWTLGVAVGLSCCAAALAAQPAAGGPGRSACSILSAEEILQISKKVNRLGMKPRGDEYKGVSQCGFVGYEFSLVGNQTAQSFEATRKQQASMKDVTVQPVAGVGDGAFYWVRASSFEPLVAIAIRVGPYRLGIQEMVPADSVEIVKPTLLALAKAAAPRLREPK